MQRSTTRVVTGVCAAALSACLLATAAPVQADSFETTADKIVTITKDVSAHSTPRVNTAVVMKLRAGDLAQALCGFTNDGSEWVKLQANGLFGFVQSTGVAGGITGLPRECPSEIESITLPAPGMSFNSPAWGVPLKGFTCPATFPFLDQRATFQWDFLVDNIGNRSIPGVQAQRPSLLGIDLGYRVTVEDPQGTGSYIGGYTGGTMSNHALWPQSATLTATCTKNAAFAWRPAN